MPRAAPAGESICFGLGAAAQLAADVATRLGIPCGGVEFREFERGEHKSRALDDVEARRVIVFAALHGDTTGTTANDRLLRLWLFVGSLRDAGASDVTVVAPYLPYMRKDRRTQPRDPLNARYVAQLFEAVGTDRLLVFEPHNVAAFENAFRIPTLPLPLAPLLADWLQSLPVTTPLVLVSPDVGGVKRVQELRALLAARGVAASTAFFEKRRSHDVMTGGAIVGDVRGSTCLIVDDLIASGGTLARAAIACREQGGMAVYAAAAHALFMPETAARLAAAHLDHLLVSDSIPPPQAVPHGLDLQVLPLAPYLADVLHQLWSRKPVEAVTELGRQPA